jgi:hypothetical protein
MKKHAALWMVDTRTLDRGQWLEVRQGGIGSSDAATAGGLNPYKSQLELWMEKTGRVAANPESAGIDDGDALGSFVLRTTSFNTICTLAARLQYFHAVSGGRLVCLPLELKLRGKSTAMSHRAAIFYVDLVIRTGLTLEQAIVEARQLDQQRRDSGYNQEALDEAARKGFANGAFEDLAEDVPAVVVEFYPATESTAADESAVREVATGLRGKLDEKVTRLGANLNQ